MTPPPVLFSGSNGVEVKTQLQAQENADLIGKYFGTGINLHQITVFEYLSKFKTIKKNTPKNGKSN